MKVKIPLLLFLCSTLFIIAYKTPLSTSCKNQISDESLLSSLKMPLDSLSIRLLLQKTWSNIAKKYSANQFWGDLLQKASSKKSACKTNPTLNIDNKPLNLAITKTLPLPAKEIQITVFVHGIMSIKPHLSISNFIRFMFDKVNNTVYSRTVNSMRKNSFFENNQVMQGLGLEKITFNKCSASSTFARLIKEINEWEAPQNPAIQRSYYTYGWAGLLSSSQRYIDAIGLYQSLTDLVEKYKKQGIKTSLRLIGYSHGGNVCLNMAAANLLEPISKKSLSIDELILIGMPVQSETDYFINDPMFKKIYHIYSRGDRIQQLDFFSTKRFFSKQIFKKRKNFNLPKKLIQIKIKVTRKTHRKKALPSTYNMNKKSFLYGHTQNLRDISPGHIELWFFGWTPANYRQNYLMNPLPTASFLPLIINCAEKFKKQSLEPEESQSIIIDLRPEFESIIVKNQGSSKNIATFKFPKPAMIERMKELSYKCAPKSYSLSKYNSHIDDAYIKSRNIYRSHYTKKHRPCRRKRSNICFQPALIL